MAIGCAEIRTDIRSKINRLEVETPPRVVGASLGGVAISGVWGLGGGVLPFVLLDNGYGLRQWLDRGGGVTIV